MSNLPRLRPLLPTLLVLLLTGASVQAATVYKYVNAQGAVTYSDTPPVGVAYEEIDLPDSPAGNAEAHQAGVERMIETTDRLRADRQQRTEERRAERPAPTATYQPAPVLEREVYFYPGYRHPYYHQRPRPAPPPYRLEPAPASRGDGFRAPLRIPQFGTGETLREKMNH